MPIDPDDVKLSRHCTRGQYTAWVQADDRPRLAAFLKERFEERYFGPVLQMREAAGTHDRHGFTMMAIGCLVVETFEAFYEGLSNTRGRGVSAKMFSNCFARVSRLQDFVSTTHGLTSGWFYDDIRCGILHEAEVRKGWRLQRRGAPLCDLADRVINPEVFVGVLRDELVAFADSFANNAANWSNFLKKMKQVCSNCER